MKEIIVKTQSELDAIRTNFDGTIYLEGGTSLSPLVLKVNFEYAYVIARGQAVLEMWGSSQVNVMRESSQVKEMWGSSQVNVMWGSSQVKEMRGEAMVSAYGLQKIICHGYNVIRTTAANKKNLTIKMNKDSHLIVIPTYKTTFADYAKRFPVQFKGDYAILYKALHKRGENDYFSDHDKNFSYGLGEYTQTCDPSKEESCLYGLHVAHLSWALNFGRSWSDMVIVECRVPIKKIVVAKDCDGKVRTSKLVIVREVPPTEYEALKEAGA